MINGNLNNTGVALNNNISELKTSNNTIGLAKETRATQLATLLENYKKELQTLTQKSNTLNEAKSKETTYIKSTPLLTEMNEIKAKVLEDTTCVANKFHSLLLAISYNTSELDRLQERCELTKSQTAELAQLKKDLDLLNQELPKIQLEIKLEINNLTTSNSDEASVIEPAKHGILEKLKSFFASIITICTSLGHILKITNASDQEKAELDSDINKYRMSLSTLEEKQSAFEKCVSTLTDNIASLESKISSLDKFNDTTIAHINTVKTMITEINEKALPFIEKGHYTLKTDGVDIQCSAILDKNGGLKAVNFEMFSEKQLKEVEYALNAIRVADPYMPLISFKDISDINSLQNELKNSWVAYLNKQTEIKKEIDDTKVTIQQIDTTIQEYAKVMTNTQNTITAIEKLMQQRDNTNLSGLINMPYPQFSKLIVNMYKAYKRELEEADEAPLFSNENATIDQFFDTFKTFFSAKNADEKSNKFTEEKIKNAIKLNLQVKNSCTYNKENSLENARDLTMLVNEFNFFVAQNKTKITEADMALEDQIGYFISNAYVTNSLDEETQLQIKNALVNKLKIS